MKGSGMESAFEAAGELGVVSVVLLLFVFGLGWALRRTLGEKGILTSLATEHIALITDVRTKIAAMETSDSEIKQACEDTLTALADLTEAAKDPINSPRRLHEAGGHACDVVETIAGKLQCADAVRPSLQQIREVLA